MSARSLAPAMSLPQILGQDQAHMHAQGTDLADTSAAEPTRAFSFIGEL